MKLTVVKKSSMLDLKLQLKSIVFAFTIVAK